MPVLFVGHGSPMNAIEDNEFSRAWRELGKELPRPSAVLCISAHWYTNGTMVTAMKAPRTIHDFFGFPKPLFDVQYPAPGSPEIAEQVASMIKEAKVQADASWGLDHGTWSVLCRMYPSADVPVLQLSLDGRQPSQFHYELGRELAALRDQGVLILGSGNIVHNLYEIDWGAGPPFTWAESFDESVKSRLTSRDDNALIHYEEMDEAARMSIPTNEHYLPMLYVLGASNGGERLRFFNERVVYGSVGMRGFVLG